MNNGKDFPTSNDGYIAIDGKRIATLESVDIKRNKNVRTHGAFGSSTAIGFSKGLAEFEISVSRAYMDDGPNASDYSFFDLENFDVVIVKPGKKEIFSPCRVNSDDESCSLGDRFMESVSILALNRREERS